MQSIQETYFPELMCFGCGPANERGLQLASHVAEDGTVRARFQPWAEHDNGLGYLNGGIIATLLDCHSAAMVSVESERLGLPPDGTLQYVTAGLDVRYRRPSPLTEPAELVARVIDSDLDEISVEAELWWQDKVRASGQAQWKRWRPR
ncbi:thioesterase [Marmoricola endophyticus]|uniref:Thioesterase n=1 Tax=Marmoricola endophyticus TaxID=2040280 RepID=A0A917BQ56_9ACTN|nr:PaaI family thioesterase [Marmoricola endophyticus]GGF54602.1 thioesterase [Marmoricola endophyticus]